MAKQKIVFFTLLIFSVLSIVFYFLYLFYNRVYLLIFMAIIFFVAIAGGLYSIYRQGERDKFLFNLSYPALVLITILIIFGLALTPIFQEAGCKYDSVECWYPFFEVILTGIATVYFVIILISNSIIFFVQKVENKNK